MLILVSLFYLFLFLYRNWCAFIVQKNISCAVQGSVESHVEPERAQCPEHQPDCEPQMM